MVMRRGRGPHVAIIACLRSACGSVILVDRRACPVDSASPRQTDRPRSPLHRPAAELSRDAARTPTDGTHTVGGGRPQLCAWNLQPADPYPRNLRRAALVVAAIQSATVRNTRGLTRSAIALMTSPLPAPPRFSKRRRNLPPFRDDPQLQLDRFGVQLRELAHRLSRSVCRAPRTAPARDSIFATVSLLHFSTSHALPLHHILARLGKRALDKSRRSGEPRGRAPPMN